MKRFEETRRISLVEVLAERRKHENSREKAGQGDAGICGKPAPLSKLYNQDECPCCEDPKMEKMAAYRKYRKYVKNEERKHRRKK